MNCGTAIWGNRRVSGHVECIDTCIMPVNLIKMGKSILRWCGSNIDFILEHDDFELHDSGPQCDWALISLDRNEMTGITQLPFDFRRVDI